MAKRLLSEREVAKIKQPGRHSLGGNIYMQVGTTGSRSWTARVTDRSGRRRDIGLGSTRDVSLAIAREKVRTIRHALQVGEDPRSALKPVNVPSFEQLAREMHRERSETYRNAKHCAQWLSSLETYVFPAIGSLPVDAVTSSDIMNAIKPIWLSKQETARRVLQRIATVTAYAVPKGFREQEIALKGIRAALPRQAREVRHHPACPVEDAPVLFQALGTSRSMSGNALCFVILTGARSGEVRGARWDEIDFEKMVWTVPAERMKAKRAHRVPLSPQAIALLRSVPRFSEGSDLIFPNNKGKPLSDTAISKALKNIAPGFTVHGWRSTFKDWATNETEFSDDLSEAALAHVDTNRVRAAYKRTDQLEGRRPLMESWANFLAGA